MPSFECHLNVAKPGDAPDWRPIKPSGKVPPYRFQTEDCARYSCMSGEHALDRGERKIVMVEDAPNMGLTCPRQRRLAQECMAARGALGIVCNCDRCRHNRQIAAAHYQAMASAMPPPRGAPHAD